MGNIIELVLQNLAELMPFVVIFSFEAGVRWTFGMRPKALKPGLHWRIWGIHNVEVVPTVDDFMETPIQSITTKDNVLVCFNVNIGYRIQDPVKHFCEVTDFHEASLGIAMSHLAERVREQTFLQISKDLKPLEKSLKGTLQTKMKSWGTDVRSVGFVNFARVPNQYRIFGGGSSLVLPE